MKNDANAFVGHGVYAHELAWHRPGKLCGAHKSFTDPLHIRKKVCLDNRPKCGIIIWVP